ncbi:MAG TPA: glycosyltransferase family 2 protein [Patescibacteria group bacterium]|nr:glycosyltransferase family 2 protein [Patescibacteria group bacterium]
MHSDTCVIIPVYNEAEALEEVLTVVRRHFKHVICVDDGSSDNSVEVLSNFDVEVLQHSQNQGQGAALRTGLQHALQNDRFKYFLTFDADGQHAVNDATRMVHYIHHHGVDIVLG